MASPYRPRVLGRWHDGQVPDPLRVAYTLEQCWHDVPGGSAVAALEVYHRLRARDDVDVVAVAGRHRLAPAPPYRPDGPVRSLPFARPWLYETWNRLEWPRVEAATGPIDVCHSTVAIPAATARPHVVTVHDVAFVHTPERFSKHGARVMRRGLDRCRRADLVLCPSRATSADLTDLGFEPGRIRVVPWGVDRVVVDGRDLDRVRRAHALPAEFVLFVGTIEPRKNLHGLVEAMRSVPELPLVVAGADGWGGTVPDTITAAGGRSGDVRFLGFVSQADLRPLVEAATVFAYPSFQEGFGLPILEAMAQGTPVVTSRGSSTEEVAGGAAALADPTDPDSIAAAVRVVLADRHRWSTAARERAARYTWESTVDATVSAYQEAAR
jgi:glycosyltransferase involved in cell wall biosynthesis